MAKIDKLPSIAIINGFKGTIDFYVWMGIPCARRWPRSPGRTRAPGVQAQWPKFAYAAKVWNSITGLVRTAYEQTAVSTNMTARDVMVKNYLSKKLIELE